MNRLNARDGFEHDPFINTAIDRGERREDGTRNCFNSFSVAMKSLGKEMIVETGTHEEA
jgi:hypothetical protein